MADSATASRTQRGWSLGRGGVSSSSSEMRGNTGSAPANAGCWAWYSSAGTSGSTRGMDGLAQILQCGGVQLRRPLRRDRHHTPDLVQRLAPVVVQRQDEALAQRNPPKGLHDVVAFGAFCGDGGRVRAP